MNWFEEIVAAANGDSSSIPTPAWLAELDKRLDKREAELDKSIAEKEAKLAELTAKIEEIESKKLE